MAITNLVGDDGKVTFASGVIASVTSWSVDATADTGENTAMMSGGWKTHLPSLKSWTGSCEVNISYEGTTNADQTATEVPLGTSGAVEFYPEGVTALITAGYSGTIIVTGYSVSSSIGGVITASVSFQGSGTLTGI